MKEPFVEFVENRLGKGFLLIACGLHGTWKTETTEEVAIRRILSGTKADRFR